MRTLARIGYLTTSGIPLIAIALAAWLAQLVRSPRVSYRSDCEMAWAALTEPDVVILGCAALVGVYLGTLYWGGRGPALRTAPHPAAIVVTLLALTSTAFALASVPGIVVLESAVRASGGSACVSAAGLHLLAAVVFALSCGMVAAAWLTPVLAAVSSLATIGVVYAVVPALTDRKLLNVGVTPLPMMDTRRSWAYALTMVAVLLALTLAMLAWVAGSGRLRLLGTLTAVGSLLLLGAPGATDFTTHHADARACSALPEGKELGLPASYRWLGDDVVTEASAMLDAAATAGVDMEALPPRFELGQFVTESGPDVSQMTLSSGFASGGHVGPLEVAGLLVTPSWCSSLRDDVPPEPLLRQASVMAVWFAVQAGSVQARDAAGLLPREAPAPASLTAAQVSAGLRAARSCTVAPWAG